MQEQSVSGTATYFTEVLERPIDDDKKWGIKTIEQNVNQ